MNDVGGRMTKMTKVRTVMELTWQPLADERTVTFTTHRENQENQVLSIAQETWVDMLAPTRITVTLEPGDLLNGAS